jgi:hypothetical protein
VFLLVLLCGRRTAEGDEKQRRHKINWDELDDLAPEWGSSDSGLEDLLSLSTAYWEPGLGPRAPRRVPYFDDGIDAAESEVSAAAAAEPRELSGEAPSAPRLNDLMHEAMHTVNSLIYNLEKDKGK